MKVYKRARLSESDQISFFIGPVPSPIIGYPCHSLTDSLTPFMTDLLWYTELNPRVHCAFGNVFIQGLAVQKHLANVYVTFTKGPSLYFVIH